MSEEKFSLADFIQNDDRYPFDAYVFVREGLNYAVEVLHMGRGPDLKNPEPTRAESAAVDDPSKDSDDADPFDETGDSSERHLTGQQLCEALRRYALHQYGFMAKIVLSNWGIRETGDFGEIVYNMIKVGLMKKSDKDQRQHFDNVFDFEEALEQQFQINQPAIFWPS